MDARPIYLDYHAHAPIDPAILEDLRSAYGAVDANPHSRHAAGQAVRVRLDEARFSLAEALDWRPSGVVFTSGATESNNLVFEGLADRLRELGRRRIVVGATEHSSVLEAAKRLRRSGFTVVEAPVDGDGLHDPAALAEVVGADVGLVSVAAANHETGVVQPLADLSAVAHAAGALFHSDLSQAFGRIPVDVGVLDAASLSAHKLCGPLGVGALCVTRRVRPHLVASLLGGGQEGGTRSGTTPVPLCTAFAAASRLAVDLRAGEAERVTALRDRLLEGLERCGGIVVNGSRARRVPGNINVSVEDVDGEALVAAVSDRLSISTGSACGSRSLEPSHVLLAMGIGTERAEGAVRIGLGRFTTVVEVDAAIAVLSDAIALLRTLRRRSAA